VTVPATARRAGPFLGTGVITALPFTFKVFEAADLVVTKTTATGLESVLELTTDYTVSLNPDQDATPGGTVTPIVALASGESLTLTSGLAYEQTLDLLGGGKFSPSSIEDAFDRTVIQIQQLAEENARTIKLPVSLPGDATLPPPVAGQVIAWGDDGVSLVNLAPEDIASVVVAGTSYYDRFSGNGATTQFTLTANPGGVNALDVVVGGVPQANGTNFTVSGTTLTFTVAPPTGTNNIGVRYTAALPIGTANAQDVTFLQSGTGAVARSAQAKLRDVVNVDDFGGNLATAVTAIGATSAQLLVTSPVSISSDLTIPSNISVRVEGAGLITVASGKRLYINGHFTAPKLKRCFNAPLLTTTITASVTGLTLNVTAVSNPVLDSGHVVTGGGLPVGVTIAQRNAGGPGVYTLNGDWGTIASTTFAVTGASVIFGPGAVDRVYPQWFGAVADSGTTDNTSFFRHAVYSQAWGGTVSIPAGNYKVSDSTVLHGGMTVEGDGVVNISNGSPSPNETAVPSHVWTSANSTSIWVIPVRADRVTIRNLSHGAAASTSGTSPIGTGRRGILFNGRAPQFVYAPVIDNCYFYNLERGIDVNDSYAASSTNWGVNPGTVRNCHFVYCTYGILFYTDNADAWKIDQCVFILAANSSGVHLVRCGFLKLDTCFAYGASLASSEFIKIAPIETGNPIDNVTIDNCQVEECAHFLTYAGANTRSFDINLRNCITELGSDIYLGNVCQFNSQGTHYMAYLYYDHPGVRINSINDWFEFLNFVSGTTWGFINAGAGSAQAIQTYIPGAFPSSALGVNARFNASAIKSAPTVQTVDNYNVTTADVAVVINRAATTTVVLPTPSLYPGRRIRVSTRQAFAILSSQSNIVSLTGGAASNSILPATAGKWVDLESDGTNWLITAGN